MKFSHYARSPQFYPLEQRTGGLCDYVAVWAQEVTLLRLVMHPQGYAHTLLLLDIFPH